MSYFKSFLIRYWYYLVIGALLILLIISSILLYFSWDEQVKENKEVIALKEQYRQEELLEVDSSIKMCTVDVKGAVKKPGVYEVLCNKKLNDVLVIAGGKTKNAYTDNINLSKKINDEMVIYVYTTKEIKNESKENTKKDEVIFTPCISETIYIDSCLEEDKSVITSQNKNDINSSENKPVESNKNSSDNIEVDNTIVDNDSDKKTEIETNVETKLISLNSATKEELMTLSGIGESKAEKIIIYREENNGFKNIEELKNVSGIGDAIFEKIKFNISI